MRGASMIDITFVPVLDTTVPALNVEAVNHEFAFRQLAVDGTVETETFHISLADALQQVVNSMRQYSRVTWREMG